jgi:hypothetical protein
MEENIVINPLLRKAVLPGETFKLPSQGLFYTHGELRDDVKNGEVHVKPMTAMDELVFKSPDMLFTGQGVVDVFARCIPQVLDAKALLSKDVDFLMVCLRMVTYGPTLQLSYNHGCKDGKEHTYEVGLQPIVRASKQIDPTTMADIFSVQLPTDQLVKLKPTTFGAMLSLNQDVDLSDSIPSLEDLKTSITAVLVDVIDSVDGISDKEQIREWIGVVSAGHIRMLTDALTQLGDWGASMKHSTKCKDCAELIDIEFSTNPVSFFS